MGLWDYLKDGYDKGKKKYRKFKKTYVESYESEEYSEIGEVVDKWIEETSRWERNQDTDEDDREYDEDYYVRIESDHFDFKRLSMSLYHDLDIGDEVEIFYTEIYKTRYRWLPPDYNESEEIDEWFSHREITDIDY